MQQGAAERDVWELQDYVWDTISMHATRTNEPHQSASSPYTSPEPEPRVPPGSSGKCRADGCELPALVSLNPGARSALCNLHAAVSIVAVDGSPLAGPRELQDALVGRWAGAFAGAGPDGGTRSPLVVLTVERRREVPAGVAAAIPVADPAGAAAARTGAAAGAVLGEEVGGAVFSD